MPWLVNFLALLVRGVFYVFSRFEGSGYNVLQRFLHSVGALCFLALLVRGVFYVFSRFEGSGYNVLQRFLHSASIKKDLFN